MRQGIAARAPGPGAGRRFAGLAAAAGLAGGCAAPAPESPAAFGLGSERRLVDLSHAYATDSVYWPTDRRGFEYETLFAGETEGGYYYAAGRFATAEHGGTHIDAPIHFAAGKPTVDRIPLERLVGPGVVIDVRRACDEDADYRVDVSDFEEWEARHGPLPEGALVLLHTGWSRHWGDRSRYLGTDLEGEAATRALHFPGLHPEAARWLVAQRRIGAIGLDTPSIDHGPSRDFLSHRILFEAEIPALENLTGLDGVPALGATVVALPMKIEGGSGGPVRIIAIVPQPRE